MKAEAKHIYGGVAGSATRKHTSSGIRETQLSDVQSQSGVKSSEMDNWSPELQAVLDQPAASFPLKVILAGAAFVGIFGVWAHFGTIDEIGNARGELVPQGDVYKIHPVDQGKIVQVSVAVGDMVQAGQVIAQLDNELAAIEVERLKEQIIAYQQEQLQKQGLLERTHLEAQTLSAISEAQIQAQQAAMNQVATRISATQSLLNQYNSEVEAAQVRLEGLAPMKGQVDHLLEQLRQSEAAAQERVERLRPLVEQGALSKEFLFQAEQTLRDRQRAIATAELGETNSSREQMFQAEQTLRDRQRAITQNQGELEQMGSEAERMEAELSQKRAEAENMAIETQQKIQRLELELTQLNARMTEARKLLTNAQARLGYKSLHAPIDGIVSVLNVANIGEVVQPGQTVAEITPDEAPLVLSASLPESQAGFLKTGLPVKVKFDAYPYQDYDVIAGTVSSISPDTVVTQGAPSPVYEMEITLERNYVVEGQEKIQFKPGQTATADIIIRRRRILDIVLEPIRKLQDSGVEF
ncbi:MAG: HlyD family efflux transporter periplasmic adaptor subunit [Microcoleaceae cyanobacterium]